MTIIEALIQLRDDLKLWVANNLRVKLDKNLGTDESGKFLTIDSAGDIGTTEIAASVTELGYVSGVTSAIQTQLNAKAPLASPTFTGTPKAPTAAAGTNTTQIATTAFVNTEIEKNKEIFIADYTEENLKNIIDAVDSGKAVFIKDNNKFYAYSNYTISSSMNEFGEYVYYYKSYYFHSFYSTTVYRLSIVFDTIAQTY